MEKRIKRKYYLFYSRTLALDEKDVKADTAHEIHDVKCAEAAANLGFQTVIAYSNPDKASINWFRLFFSFPAKKAQETVYGIL